VLQRLLPARSVAEIADARTRVAPLIPPAAGPDATLLDRLAEPSITLSEAVVCGLVEDEAPGTGCGSST
jgi:hypothetical protein